MVDPAAAPPRQSALGALPVPRTAAPPALQLHERHHLLIRQIAVWRAADVRPLRTALAERLGIALPDGPTAVGGGGRRALRLAPRRWWLIEEQPGAVAAAALEAALAGRAALTDLSHARTVLRLAGPASRSVLAKLCRIDLHPRAFPPGQVAQTALGQLPALLHACDDASGFDLYLPRSLARSGAASVIDAAEEYGVELG